MNNYAKVNLEEYIHLLNLKERLERENEFLRNQNEKYYKELYLYKNKFLNLIGIIYGGKPRNKYLDTWNINDDKIQHFVNNLDISLKGGDKYE